MIASLLCQITLTAFSHPGKFMTFCYLFQMNSLDFKDTGSAVDIFGPCDALLSKPIERLMVLICLCLSSGLSVLLLCPSRSVSSCLQWAQDQVIKNAITLRERHVALYKRDTSCVLLKAVKRSKDTIKEKPESSINQGWISRTNLSNDRKKWD